jgi:hypothetical protein
MTGDSLPVAGAIPDFLSSETNDLYGVKRFCCGFFGPFLSS